MKLSDIWRRADKELRQVRGSYGNAALKTACATGAIAYYMSNGRTCSPWRLTITELGETGGLCFDFQIRTANRHTINELNDNDCWTFIQFAEEAGRHGL